MHQWMMGLLVTVAVVLASCSGSGKKMEQLLAIPYEVVLVGETGAGPELEIDHVHYDQMLVLLHYGFDPEEIRKVFDWSREKIQRRLGKLEKAGLVSKDGHGIYHPTFLVVGPDECAALKQASAAAADSAANLVRRQLPAIRERLRARPMLQDTTLMDNSLHILGNILFDTWQFINVENNFLETTTAPGDSNRYHLALMARPPALPDSFNACGLYQGHLEVLAYGAIGTYGRTTNHSLNFLNLSWNDTAQLFDIPSGFSPQNLKVKLVRDMVNFWVLAPYYAKPEFIYGLTRLGLLTDVKPRYPLFSQADLDVQTEIMNDFAPHLLALLEAVREQIEAAFAASAYATEVEFPEYFFWWYRFFMTQAIDLLRQSGEIREPDSGVFSYVIAPEVWEQ